ncbi:MAG: hypothetical protein ACFFCD_13350 [Promethearchaeota archaeon]
MIHSILLVKDFKCIYNYKTGTKKSLDENLFTGLLDTIFSMGKMLFRKKISKIMFKDVQTVFQPLTRAIFLGIVEDAANDKDSIELLLKEVSKALYPIISLLEQKRINPDAIQQIPWIEQEITVALAKALQKIPCSYLAKKRIGGYYCNFIKEFIGHSDDLCNLSDFKKCSYFQDESYHNDN